MRLKNSGVSTNNDAALFKHRRPLYVLRIYQKGPHECRVWHCRQDLLAMLKFIALPRIVLMGTCAATADTQ
jgi:hypothetical protein